MKCPVCKKNISDTALKCPYCKTRTGILCTHCNTVNPIGNLVCKNCSQELLKICPHCKSVNLPLALKCRKCGTSFGNPVERQLQKNSDSSLNLNFRPNLYPQNIAFEILQDGLHSKKQKIFSITGEKGLGKTTLLKKAIQNPANQNLEWCIGKCTPLTQLTPGGVIQDMLLNLFNLPKIYISNDELQKDAVKFFTNEFKFLNQDEISDLLNFLYNSKDGNYEDIIINKKKTYFILYKIFDAFVNTGRFVFVIDNFDYIDGFSIEFFTNFVQDNTVWKNLKFIILYNEHRPVLNFFSSDDKDIKAFVDIHLSKIDQYTAEETIKLSLNSGIYVSEREKEIIFSKCKGNPAFIEQAVSYCFDCQISDKAFIMPNTFEELIKNRLQTLKQNNSEAYKLLAAAAISGDRIHPGVLQEICGCKNQNFTDIISYLVKSNFIRPYNDSYFEFNNLLLWETVLNNVKEDKDFEDINIKAGRTLSLFKLNTSAAMASIAHNLKEHRMAFDIWTKITRLAAYVGDINLYVIGQKQCLALLNEFNENETLNIRYNISERLGKLLTGYDPEEALEFLPDAIANARNNNNETKEIELLGYLSLCCKKTGKYFGDTECVNNALKRLPPSGYELETALMKCSKLESLIKTGRCGEVINLIDNEILPILDSNLANPRLDKTIPLGFIYDTKLKATRCLAQALALQGNDRAFDILEKLFDLIEKNKISDEEFICKIKLTQALANTMKGNFYTSFEVLQSIIARYGEKFSNLDTINSTRCEIINTYSIIDIINRFMIKDYEGIQESLFASVQFANDTENHFTKHLLSMLLGKVFYDRKQAKHAMEIYDAQIEYFAKEKIAFGALLGWYLIAQAALITESPNSAIDTASRALEIAQDPQINNYFFIIMLKTLLAKCYMEISDYETAKINLESALILAKKYNINDQLSRLYLLYGKYYQDLGSLQSQNQNEYLKGASAMYDRALSIINSNTKNPYIRQKTEEQRNLLNSFCSLNGIGL